MEAIQPAVAEITVSYLHKQRAKDRPQISCSSDAYNLLIQGFNPNTIALQEQFLVAYLDRSNRSIGVYRLATGGVTGVVCDPRLVLGVALKSAASALVLCHSHPSGNLKPSRADEEITTKIRDGAKLFDIKLLDHLIVGPDEGEFFSFADEGIL